MSEINFHSKLPMVGTNIFTQMSSLAREHGAINLSQGFPNYDISEKLKGLAQEYIQGGYNQYAPMAGVSELREALADKMKNSYGPDIDAEKEITITAGATQAIYTAISAFIKPEDEVILIEPAYDCYSPAVIVNGGRVVAYPLSFPEYAIDWKAFGRLINSKTRMIIINTPHNPTGTILRDSDLNELAKLVENKDIIILSDEVYEHLIYDEENHASVLSHPVLKKRALVTFSFGKTFHGTGWKLGYCVGPEYLTNEFRKVHQFNVFCVNHPFQKAIASFLTDPTEYTSLAGFYQKKRDFLQAALASSKLKPLTCTGTYFQLYDYSELSDEDDLTFAKRITKEYGVASIPISPFYSHGSDAKVIRLCFAKTEEVLAQAGEKLCKIR